MRQNNTFHTTVTLIMREQIFLTEGSEYIIIF